MRISLSVRSRLAALGLGLLVIMGSANVWLGYIISQHQSQLKQQQEQYRRVEVIYAVVQAISDVRFAQGQVNSARLFKDSIPPVEAQRIFDKAQAVLDERLKKLGEFDPQNAARISTAFALIPSLMQALVGKMGGDEPVEEKKLLMQVKAEFVQIEGALAASTQHEKQRAEVAEKTALAQANQARKLSLLIIGLSTLFGAALAVLVTRSILRPLQVTVKAIREVNAGQTALDLPPITRDEFGDMAQALRQFRDQAEHLREQALTDPLTGLGNRSRFEEALRNAMTEARQLKTRLAMVYVDLDGFSTINDSLGHRAGDRYLCEAATRLLRFAPSDALVCRYSGDKFIVLLDALAEGAPQALQLRLQAITGNLLRGLREPYQLAGSQLVMSASAGVAVYPDDGENSETLFSGAETAMYRAKQGGRNGLRFANAEQTAQLRNQLSTATDIRRGVQAGEFEPFYQPIVDARLGRVIGAEALLRWRHPQRGVLSGHQFIEIAETVGLIHALGEVCLYKAAEQARAWESTRHLRMAVNLSVRQIEDRSALGLLEKIHAHAPVKLDLEITESAALERIDKARETLDEIRALGHRLSADDFGTGYASMTYVQRFSLDKIKIDRSFVSRIDSSREAVAIIAALLALARSLDMDVVAEGVETPDQSRRLLDMGCHLQQGYWFSPALAAPEFQAWMIRYETGQLASSTAG